MEALFTSILSGEDPSQVARGFFGPLTDPSSKGKGLKDDAEGTAAMYEALEADPTTIMKKDVRQGVGMMGRRPAWAKRLLDGAPLDKDIQELCSKWVADKLAEMQGGYVSTLKSAGWLTQEHAGRIRTFTESSGLMEGGLKDMERYAFCQALAILAPHYKKRVERAAARIQQAIDVDHRFAEHMKASWWGQVEAYEVKRNAAIERDSGHTPKEPYKVGRGTELRGWYKVRALWLGRRWDGAMHPSQDELRSIFYAFRDENPEDCGDHALFEWLSEPSQWLLWDGGHVEPEKRGKRADDLIGHKAKYNRDSVPMKNVALTIPDPVAHPKPVNFGRSAAGDGMVDPVAKTAKLRLVSATGRDKPYIALYDNHRVSVVDGQVLLLDGSGRRGTGLPATMKGVGLRLNRAHLRTVPNRALYSEQYPTAERYEEMVRSLTEHLRKVEHPVYFTVALELPVPALRAPSRKTEAKFPMKSSCPAFLLRATVPSQVGLRVLGVDLGMRQSATVASGVLVDSKPTGLSRRIGENLWLKIESVKVLQLPEDHGSPILAGATDQDGKPISIVRNASNILYKAGRLISYQNRVAKELDGAFGGRAQSSKVLNPEIPLKLAEELGLASHAEGVRAVIGDPAKVHAAWDALAIAARDLVLQSLPPSKQAGAGGLSFDHMILLENFLRFERKFATRGRKVEKRKFEGTFHPRLRTRINRMREDRVKKVAASLIAEAIRVKADVIAVEDLNRYKMKWERPKRENGKLAQWSHRAVLDKLVLAAEIRGISVATTYANYANQMSAITGAPGIRVGRYQDWWAGRSGWMKQAPNFPNVVPGQLVPDFSGPMLVTVDAAVGASTEVVAPKVVRKNAAIMAAVRYFTYDECPARLILMPHKDGFKVVTVVPAWHGMLFAKQGDTYVPTGKRVNLDASGDDDVEVDSESSTTVAIIRDLTGTVRDGAWMETKPFWEAVAAIVTSKLQATGAIGDLLNELERGAA
jgi:IS605 OrfB family transposase